MTNDITIPEDRGVLAQNEDDMTRVVRKALATIEAILDMEIPEGTEKRPARLEDQARVLAIKKDAAASIISAGLKADENRFRRENKDIIERLFEKMKNNGKIVEGQIIKGRK